MAKGLGSLCIAHPNIIKKFSSHTDLQQDLVNAIHLIEKATMVETSPIKNLSKFVLTDKITTEPMMTLEEKQEILVISSSVFRKINGMTNDEYNYAGGYHNKSGRIFLVEDCWCYSNLIHETLHSRSVFSKFQPEHELKFVFE